MALAFPTQANVRPTVRALALLVACALAGCSAVGPRFEPPQAALQEQWTAIAGVTPAGIDEDRSALDWWSRFEDPVLQSLLLEARAGNLDLQAAAARVEQAQAELDITRSGRWPTIQASTGVTYSNPDTASQLQGGSEGSSTAQIALSASWEPDFWGKVRRGIEADEADRQASITAWQAARVSLDASVASTYFSLRTLQQRVDVAEANLVQQAENLRIAQARYRAGATSELDLHQARSQYEQTRAQLPSLRGAIVQTTNALAILGGQPPTVQSERFAASARTPRIPTQLPLGIPRDLLRRRPDVRQAEYVAAAQSARIGQARAALYPSLSLGGSFGAQSTDVGGGSLSDIFSWTNPVQSLSASVLVPIFDRRRLHAQVRVQDALFEQALLAYQTQVLQAQREVEDALAAIGSGAQSRDSLARARDSARRSAELALLRYKSGESDYTTVISADQSRLQAEDALAQAEGDLLQSWVAAYRALGGGWNGETDATEMLPASVQSTSRPQTPSTDLSHLQDSSK